MKLGYALLLILVSFQSYAGEFAEGGAAPAAPAPAAPAEAVAPKVNLDEIRVTDGSLRYVKDSLRNRLPDAETLRKLGLCEIDKAHADLNKLPLGSIIIRRDGNRVLTSDITVKSVSGPGHLEYKSDFKPWGGWKLAEIRAIYKTCPAKR